MAKRAELKAVRTGAGSRAKGRASEKAAEEARASAKTKLTILMPADLVRELRSAWQALPSEVFPSITGVVTEATRVALQRMRDDYNDGEPFKVHGTPKVSPGRRPKD